MLEDFSRGLPWSTGVIPVPGSLKSAAACWGWRLMLGPGVRELRDMGLSSLKVGSFSPRTLPSTQRAAFWEPCYPLTPDHE